jgi:uncharacterized protein (DUF952 family)
VTHIYHITGGEAAAQARQSGEYRAESLESQGFIHFSQIHQVLGVANNFYTGQTGLVVLVVDTDRLKAPLKFEPPVHPGTPAVDVPADGLFPHLYGPLNFDAVLRVVDLPAGPRGDFELPPLE